MELQIINTIPAVTKRRYQKPAIEIVQLVSNKMVLGGLFSCQDVIGESADDSTCDAPVSNCKEGS